MPSTVIVALPEDDDPVWEFSSEKKPHLTLLYLNASLGTNEEEILQFVQHAANTSLSRFGLSVDHRGTLGPDDADVLFFDTGNGISAIRAFRAQLLKNDEIAKNYIATDQFPGWTPHLTMGYPEKPAKPLGLDNRYMLHWINFDRIAVWTSDFEGPEFELKKHDWSLPVDDPEAAWSEKDGVYLVHSGVKGMHWGVRKEDKSGPSFASSGTVKEHNVRTDQLIRDVKAAKREDHIERVIDKGYLNDYIESNMKVHNIEVSKNKKKITYEMSFYHETPGKTNTDSNNGVRVTHLTKTVDRDPRPGMSVADHLEQSAILTSEDYLAHYGRRGMKWGVRKDVAGLATLRTGDGGTIVAPGGKKPSKSDRKESAKVMGEVRAHLLRGSDSPFRPNGEIPKLRDSYSRKPNTPRLTDEYNNKVSEILTKYANTKIPSGAISHVFVQGNDAFIAIGSPDLINQWKETVSHSNEDASLVYRMPLLRDEDGFITGLDPDSEMELDDDVAKHDAMSEDEYLAHYGRLGMKWGVRRSVGSNGLVKGSVESAIKKGQTPDTAKVLGKVKRGASEDHRKVSKNIKKDVSQLSTAEIKEITKRLQAVKELNKATAEEKAAQAGIAKKLASFALNSVTAGVKKKADSYIQELVGDQLEGILPKTPSGKKRAEKEKQAQQDRADKKAKENKDKTDKAAKDAAIADLVDEVYNVTTLPKKGD